VARSSAPPDKASSDKPDLAFGVVGLRFGANHARVLSNLDGVRLAALCDTDESRLAAAAKGLEVATFRDYNAMLSDVELDAVVVAVPAALHEPMALAAVAAGCDLLVEKPLAPCLADGIEVVKAARSAGVLLMPGHLERFNPAVQELARRLHRGDAGKVLHLAARRMGPIVLRSQDVNVVHDTALHDIDAMRFVLSAEVERAFAEGRCDLEMPFEDSIAAVLRFSPPMLEDDRSLPSGDPGPVHESSHSRGDAGPTATLDVNWLAPGRIRDLTVRGSEGTFFLDYLAQSLSFQAKGAPSPAAIEIETKEPLLVELTAFVASLKQGKPPPVSPRDGLMAVAVCDAITESARTGLPVVPAIVK
jgi:UDP-N-acetylglucosamine 3-dehydrogenase